MKLAATEQLYSYWRALRGGRSAPERNDIDPTAIRGVLADTFILEYDRPAGFPMRIAGTRTNALFQRELRGTPFLELWKHRDRPEIASLIASVCDEAQPFLLGGAGAPAGGEPIDVELLLLPLRHHGATHARVLGSCAPRRSPSWLGLLPIGAVSLVSLRALRPEDSEPELLTEVAAPPRADRGRRHGHLMVYSNDR